ncbi:hypothetical protein [Novosphingobium sp. KA1]|uniref:hypothetical protein n=1 Tax=Novosphingobium sp. (strain KA1) TaxID=164608 RepID=UPI001A8DE25E|nr:hypothetical protein [Novosphingobium sp. KA1]QSR15631.1 hypothetical protein CA833_00150 [Novosphingobium sp. KA1]
MTDGNGEEQFTKLGCSLLAEEGGSRVVAIKSPLKDFESLQVKEQGRFVGIMKGWCAGRKLMPKMFNYNEGRSKINNVMLQAFKGFKHRFYGFPTEVDGIRTFVVVKADLDKKQDKADPIVLGRALEIADELQSNLNANAKGKGQ